MFSRAISGVTSRFDRLINENGNRQSWFYKDNGKLKCLLMQKKYFKIIQNKQLAIELFSSLANKDEYFLEYIEQVQFKKYSRTGLTPEIERYIEQIRQIFEGAFGGDQISVFFPVIKENVYIAEIPNINNCDRPQIHLCRIKKENKNKVVGIEETVFVNILKPIFEKMAEALGATYFSRTIHDLRVRKIKGVTSCDVKVLNVFWERKAFFEHHIQPKIIEHKNEVIEQYYLDYQNTDNCDLVLSAEGEKVLVHREIFRMAAGSVFESMLNDQFSESINSSIDFEIYSINTVKTFVEFIYLGVDGIPIETFNETGTDICQLLQMAHMYQIVPLYNHCLNILDVYSDKDDAEVINELAKFYNDRHLKDLYENLTGILLTRVYRV